MLRTLLNWRRSIIVGSNSVEQGGTDFGTGLPPFKAQPEIPILTRAQQRKQIADMDAIAKELLKPRIPSNPPKGPQDIKK